MPKYTVNLGLNAEVEATDEADAINVARELTVGEGTLTSIQVLPVPENQNV